MTSPNLTSAADSVLDSPARKFPHVSSRHPVLYCVILLLIPLAAMVATLFIVRTSWFLLRSGNPYIATVGFGATLHNASCDVLIDGDSTAMVGIIPRIITQQTGLSSCNIAEFAGMEQVNGHLTLNQFLANNPRPKYIVFVYVPESLRSHEEWSPVSHFEAILYRLRTQPDAAFFHALLTHPGDTFSSWTLALRLAVLAPIHRSPCPPEVLAQRSVNRGWFEVPGRVLDSCQMPESYTQPDATYIDSLRRQFGANGTPGPRRRHPRARLRARLQFFHPWPRRDRRQSTAEVSHLPLQQQRSAPPYPRGRRALQSADRHPNQ